MVKLPIAPPVSAGEIMPPSSLWQNLKRHPFPVAAWFDRVVALSFAFPEEVLRPLVPQGLAIDAFDGLGFVTVAMVWTKDLRPAALPTIFGQDFFLAGYRIFTRLNDKGRRLRGLKILHSETDRRRMAWLGNLMTGYHYRHAKVEILTRHKTTEVRTRTCEGTASRSFSRNRTVRANCHTDRRSGIGTPRVASPGRCRLLSVRKANALSSSWKEADRPGLRAQCGC